MSADPIQPVMPTCPRCGSDDICSDAAARWNTTTQQWEVSGILDPMSCQTCEVMFLEATWVPVQP